MFKVTVERLIAKDIDTIFEALTDHENYQQFPGISASALLEQGSAEKNGVGALRSIVAGPLSINERITHYDRPARFGYQIVKSRPLPIQHEGGDIVLSEVEGGTRVVWSSYGRVKIPLLGSLFLDRVLQQKLGRGFNAVLNSIANKP